MRKILDTTTLLCSKFQKDTEEKKAAELLINEVKRLNTSITALLDYARPLPLHKRQVELNEFLSNSINLIESDAQELGITTRLEIDPKVSTALVDPDRINQVLLNLYLNGLQAMGKDGNLTVRTKKGRENETFRIEIHDRGCGIPEDHLKQILTQYFTTKPDGTGLSLAMANKIIDEHGGSIKFSRRVNEGTKVIITLPIQ